jgi:hypothetical protein
MKIIQHSVFVASEVYSVFSVLSRKAGTLRLHERQREEIREQAEEFIKGIGVENVVSVTEHAPTLGPFSVVVWWRRETTNTDALVVRVVDEEQSA